VLPGLLSLQLLLGAACESAQGPICVLAESVSDHTSGTMSNVCLCASSVLYVCTRVLLQGLPLSEDLS
jgi:hypothetical protein